jgi:hypothetical protein
MLAQQHHIHINLYQIPRDDQTPHVRKESLSEPNWTESTITQSLSPKPEPQPRHIAQSRSEGRTANSSSDSYPIYHSLEQRRSSERSRHAAASTRRNHRVRNGNTPNRACISAPSPSGRSPASTLLPKQTNKQPSADSDRANRSTYHSAGGVGSGPAAPRAKRRLRWRDRSRRPPPARRREVEGSWRRSCRRASPRRDRRRRRRRLRWSGWG